MLLPRLSLLSYVKRIDTQTRGWHVAGATRCPSPLFPPGPGLPAASQTRFAKSNDRLCMARSVELRMLVSFEDERVGRASGVCSGESGREWVRHAVRHALR